MSFLGDVTNTLNSAAGVMSPVGAIAGGVSALGSLFGSNDDSMEIAKMQHEWDVEENQKNRDFQREEWQRQFDAVNAYNDPKAAKQRLMKAGLNGSAIMNGQGSAIGQSSASPSAPSGAHGLNPMPDIVSQVGYQSRESLMKRLSMLGDLSKNAYLLPETKQKLSAEIQDTLNDARFKDIKADSEEFMLSLEKHFGASQRSADIKRALAQVALADAETKLRIKQGEEVDANVALKAEEKLLTIAKRHLSEKELEILKIDLKYRDAQRRQEIEESKSRQAQNYASARESSASADQIEFFNKINSRPDVKHEIVRAAKEQGQAAVNANKLSASQAKHLEYLIEQAAYANDMKEFTYWSNQINGFVGTLGDAVSSFYGAGALRELIKLRQLQQVKPSRVNGFQP